jgi:hypothetical protein
VDCDACQSFGGETLQRGDSRTRRNAPVAQPGDAKQRGCPRRAAPFSCGGLRGVTYGSCLLSGAGIILHLGTHGDAERLAVDILDELQSFLVSTLLEFSRRSKQGIEQVFVDMLS